MQNTMFLKDTAGLNTIIQIELKFHFQRTPPSPKLHVVPDFFSRRSDTPNVLLPATPVPVTDISNVSPAYQSHLGPPSWVSGPSVLGGLESSSPHQPLPDYALLAVSTDQPDCVDTEPAALGLFSVFRQQPSQQELCDADTLEELVIGTAIAALSNLDFPLYTVSPNSV